MEICLGFMNALKQAGKLWPVGHIYLPPIFVQSTNYGFKWLGKNFERNDTLLYVKLYKIQILASINKLFNFINKTFSGFLFFLVSTYVISSILTPRPQSLKYVLSCPFTEKVCETSEHD